MEKELNHLIGKVQTVNGVISPMEMGITLSHEHCLVDNTAVFTEPRKASAQQLANETLSLKNIGYVRYNVLSNKDNLMLTDERLSIEELSRFKLSGGMTIVDASNDDLGRDPMALRRISKATGLHIVMGSGFYVDIAQDEGFMSKLTEDDIANIILREIVEGVNNSGICVGLIGEIGCSWPLEKSERKVLRAAGLAQKRSGAPLQIHPGRDRIAPFEIVEVLREVGADINHTAICHIERTIQDEEDLKRLAETGCYLEYDLWGLEGYYPESLAIVDLPNDSHRIAQIKKLISWGYGEKLLLSYDICYKCRYFAYGGHGYDHLIVNIVPAMFRRGMEKEQIDMLLIDNPKSFFTFARTV